MPQKIGLIVTELASFYSTLHSSSASCDFNSCWYYKMPLLRFTTLTALAIIPWSIIFIYLGEKLGENWENINDIASPYVKSFAIGGVVLILLYFVIKMDKKRKNLA